MICYKPQGSAWVAPIVFKRGWRPDPNMVWLISYPRTGSHWLRMILESYTGRPLLPRTFFSPNENAQPLLIHDHDRTAETNIQPHNVLFLYRNPIDTVFSLANYWMVFDKWIEQNTIDQDTVRYTRDYMKHLRKWLVTEKFTRRKTVIRYENISPPGEDLARTLEHFGLEYDLGKISETIRFITKDEVRRRTQDMDRSALFANRVIAPEADYETRKTRFHAEKTQLVWDTIKEDPAIAVWFEELA